MFGLLSPARKDANYCRAYSHLCQSHRKHSGLALLPFHSYESILIYLLSVDAGIVPLDDKAPVVCCKLSKRLTALTDADESVSHFCSAFSTLLAYIKLTDDVRDGFALRSKLALAFLRRRFEAAFTFFETLDPNFQASIESILASHERIEELPCSDLREFLRPTAEGFGYVFSLLAACWKRSDHAESLREIGRAIGSAIVSFDAAYDYFEDRRLGRYNPLADETLVPFAVDTAKKHLVQAAELAATVFGSDSHSTALLRSVDETIILDSKNQASKGASHFDESLSGQCATRKVFGFVPVPVLGDMSNDDCSKVLLFGGAGIVIWGINHFCKSQCGCVTRQTTTDSRGREVRTEKGPCGC